MFKNSQPYDWSNKLWSDQVNSSFLFRLREAVAEHVLPYADEIDEKDYYPTKTIKELSRLGYTNLTLPKQWGGLGASFKKCAAVFEETSYASAAVGISLITILQAQTL